MEQFFAYVISGLSLTILIVWAIASMIVQKK